MIPHAYPYILVMGLVTYLIRVLPITLIRRQIKNRFLRSFLYYVPYVTLAVMTFPDMIYATESIYSGIAALLLGCVLAWRGASLLKVAVAACAAVFLVEMLIAFLP